MYICMCEACVLKHCIVTATVGFFKFCASFAGFQFCALWNHSLWHYWVLPGGQNLYFIMTDSFGAKITHSHILISPTFAFGFNEISSALPFSIPTI